MLLNYPPEVYDKYTTKVCIILSNLLNRLFESRNSCVSESLRTKLELSILWKFTKAVLFFVEGIFKPGVQNVGAKGDFVYSSSRRHIQSRENKYLKVKLKYRFQLLSYNPCQYNLWLLFLINYN